MDIRQTLLLSNITPKRPTSLLHYLNFVFFVLVLDRSALGSSFSFPICNCDGGEFSSFFHLVGRHAVCQRSQSTDIKVICPNFHLRLCNQYQLMPKTCCFPFPPPPHEMFSCTFVPCHSLCSPCRVSFDSQRRRPKRDTRFNWRPFSVDPGLFIPPSPFEFVTIDDEWFQKMKKMAFLVWTRGFPFTHTTGETALVAILVLTRRCGLALFRNKHKYSRLFAMETEQDQAAPARLCKTFNLNWRGTSRMDASVAQVQDIGEYSRHGFHFMMVWYNPLLPSGHMLSCFNFWGYRLTLRLVTLAAVGPAPINGLPITLVQLVSWEVML